MLCGQFLKIEQDQWKRKKQTPEQKKAARMAKLDPANWKSAKDVYDERSAEAAKKRKREDGENERASGSLTKASDMIEAQPSKKQKSEDSTKSSKPVPTEKIAEKGESEEALNANLRKRAKKRANRNAKKQLDNQRLQDKQERKAKEKTEKLVTSEEQSNSKKERKEKTVKKAQQSEAKETSLIPTPKNKSKEPVQQEQRSRADLKEQPSAADKDQNQDGEWSDVEEDEHQLGETEANTEEGLEDDEDVVMEDAASTATSSDGVPNILSPPHDSAASSVSSVQPPPKSTTAGPTDSGDTKTPSKGQKDTQQTLPSQTSNTVSEADRLAARQRLQEQIANYRTQRKADEKAPRSRAELLEQRRRKEEERKAAKKAQRQKEKEEEAKRQDEEMARRFSPGGSGSLLASPRSPIVDTGPSSGGGYTYGRIAFDDGTTLDPNTLSAAEQKKHKGPQDTATALKAAQAKQTRLAGLDESKRADIAEKDMWLNARKRAHGEKVKDDQSLLKKALKRQEKQKNRSGTEWDKRTEGVRSAQEAKQKKRTENLQKRKDEKFSKKAGLGKKKVKRPGFEGSFRGRTGKGKKN